MNWFLRGAIGLAILAGLGAASAGATLAQTYGPPPAGYPAAYDPPLAGGSPMRDRAPPPRLRDDMPGPDRGYDPYGFDRQGVSRDGYDIWGYDDHGYDRYGFDRGGFTRDGFDRYGYDQGGLDRYGRRAPARYGRVEPRPAPAYDDERPPSGAYGYDDHYRVERQWAGGSDRYGSGPRDYWDEPADGYYVPSFGGALQHYADPRCNTCRAPVRQRDCGCYSSPGSIALGPSFFYDYGGVGPIPDGGYGGGGGYVVMGGGSAHASSSASAFASSSSRVSVRVGGGGGGHKGGCMSCGGHR